MPLVTQILYYSITVVSTLITLYLVVKYRRIRTEMHQQQQKLQEIKKLVANNTAINNAIAEMLDER